MSEKIVLLTEYDEIRRQRAEEESVKFRENVVTLEKWLKDHDAPKNILALLKKVANEPNYAWI